MAADYEVSGLEWSTQRLLPAFQTVQHLTVYDVRGVSSAIQLAVSTLIGLINRPLPRVYVITADEDLYWLQHCFHSVSLTYAAPTGAALLSALLAEYRAHVQGLIIYDPALIDTINVATILAGQRDGMVVSPELAATLQVTHALPLLVDLRTYHWRSRLQAYHWALQNLLPNSSTRLLAGLDPHKSHWLRPFLVATRTFIYWLDSRPHLSALPAPHSSERLLMQQILGSFKSGATHLGWFQHESSGVALTSQAAMLVLASDYCSNLEVWSAVPAPPFTFEPVHTTPPPINNSIYLSFTISDGDNLQYCQRHLLKLWHDPLRGSLPIGWTLAPSLVQVAPTLAAYYLNSATPNDELLAGPSGAGYMFPSYWPPEHLPAFLQRTGALMQAMHMTTLEVLDADPLYGAGLPLVSKISLTGMAFQHRLRQQDFVRALNPYGVSGILSGAGFILYTHRRHRLTELPLYHNLGLVGSVQQTLNLIHRVVAARPQRPLFLNLYILAWTMRPSDLQQVIAQLDEHYQVVLPRTLLAMLSQTL